MKIITAEDLTSFNLIRGSDCEVLNSSAVLTEMVHHHLQSVTYRVVFPRLVTTLSGRYTITVTNAGQRSDVVQVFVSLSDCK